MDKIKIKLKQNRTIYFDELTHSYLRKKDYKELSGVTSLMCLAGLAPDYSAVPAATLQAAADRGTATHKAIEASCKGLDIGDVTPEIMSNLSAFQALDLNVIANEYLVSDNESVASSIDVVLGDLTLADIKTTSVVHKEACRWQLSIYKYLFELQNPALQVPRLEVIHIRDGVAKIVELEPLPKEQVIALIESYKDGAFESREAGEPQLPQIVLTPTEEEVVTSLQRMETSIRDYKATIERLEAEEKDLKNQILSLMEAHAIKKWQPTDNLIFTKVEASSSWILDSKRIKEENPDVFEAYKKERITPARLLITIK